MLATLVLSQPQRGSTVRVKGPPPVINERTRRRISDEEIGFGEDSASHGQEKQDTGGAGQVAAGHGQDKQDLGDAKQAPACQR